MNDDKIIRNIKERMAISNLERECSMNKKGSKKLLLSLAALFVVTGSLVTVNAVTDGSIANAVKDVIPDIPGFTKTETQTDEGTLVKYEKTNEDGTQSWGTTYVDAYGNIDPGFLDKLQGIVPQDKFITQDQMNELSLYVDENGIPKPGWQEKLDQILTQNKNSLNLDK